MLLEGGRQDSQIISPLVKVPEVEIVFFLEDVLWHFHNHIDSAGGLRFDHGSRNIAANYVDLGGFAVGYLVGRVLGRFGVGERDDGMMFLFEGDSSLVDLCRASKLEAGPNLGVDIMQVWNLTGAGALGLMASIFALI